MVKIGLHPEGEGEEYHALTQRGSVLFDATAIQGNGGEKLAEKWVKTYIHKLTKRHTNLY
jgi:hypothetical protein